MHVVPRRPKVVRASEGPPWPRLCGREGAIHRVEKLDQVAVDFDGAGHVGLSEVQIRVPNPAEQRAAVLEPYRRDVPAVAGKPEAVPEHEADRRRRDALLHPSEGPAVERRRSEGRGLIRQGRNEQWVLVHMTLNQLSAAATSGTRRPSIAPVPAKSTGEKATDHCLSLWERSK